VSIAKGAQARGRGDPEVTLPASRTDLVLDWRAPSGVRCGNYTIKSATQSSVNTCSFLRAFSAG
jgi:hypothetical protein